MQTHYNDIIQETLQKFRTKCELFEHRDLMLRKKIEKIQDVHIQKLAEFQEKENEFIEKQKNSEILEEKYKKNKEKYKTIKDEVSKFKAECKEKLKKSRADIDIREKLEECEKKVEILEKEKNDITNLVKNEAENDKLEFLKK